MSEPFNTRAEVYCVLCGLALFYVERPGKEITLIVKHPEKTECKFDGLTFLPPRVELEEVKV